MFVWGNFRLIFVSLKCKKRTPNECLYMCETGNKSHANDLWNTHCKINHVLAYMVAQNTYYSNKMKNEKFHSIGTVPKSNSKIIKRGIIDTITTHIHVPLTHIYMYP